MLSFATLFSAWMTVFSVSFMFIPMLQVRKWKERKSAEGFSSVNMVIPCLGMSCWLGHGYITGDYTNVLINILSLAILSYYLYIYAYYITVRRYLYGQLLVLFVALYYIFKYVNAEPNNEVAGNTMGRIAATVQILSLAGGIYEIKRAISFRHTEYIPAEMQFGILFLIVQWTIYGLLMGNYHMVLANMAGLAVTLVTISLYVIYPPLTWRVPIIGTGPQQKQPQQQQQQQQKEK